MTPTRKEPDMRDQETQSPQRTQEVSKQALQEKPAAFQEPIPGLGEELLEEVMGAGGCCSRVFSVFQKSSPVPPIDKGKGIAPPTPYALN
jgi:hypothetical protein